MRACGCVIIISLGCLLALSPPVLAQVKAPQPGLSLPDQLTPWAMEEIEQMFVELGKKPDWNSFRANLDLLPNTAVVRYTRAVADMRRGAIWDGQKAETTLWELYQNAASQADHNSNVLAAYLLLSIGRGQLALRHNKDGLATIERAIDKMRQLGEHKGLVKALFEMSFGLIHQSRRPRDALAYINELLVTAHRLKLKDDEVLATRLYDSWRKYIADVDDYFGRASNRLQYFTPAIGIPVDADLVAVTNGALIMNGDTDDQMPAAAPEFVLFDGLFVRKLKLPSDTLELRGSMLDKQGNLWAATNRGLYYHDGRAFTQLYNPELADEESNDLAQALKDKQVVARTIPLLSNIVNEIKQGLDGRLYLATNAGASIFDPQSGNMTHFTKKNAPLPKPVERIAPVPDGSLVVAWQDEYAVRLKNGKWMQAPFDFPIVAGRPHGHLFGLLVDRDGHAWVHGLGGAQQLTGSKVSRYVDSRFSTVTRNVNHLLKASDEAYWFASTDGVCRQSGNSCATLNAGRWLPAEWALDLLEWPEANIWLSVYQGGLNRFMPPHYRQFGLAEGFRQPINDNINELGGYLFITNGEGLVRLDPASGRIDNFISSAEGIPVGELTVSLRLSTDLLALTGPDINKQKNLILFDGQQGKELGPQSGLPGERIQAICEPEPGIVLIAFLNSIQKLDTRDLTLVPIEEYEQVAKQRVTALECAPGRPVWILTHSGEVFTSGPSGLVKVPASQTGLEGKPQQLISTKDAGVFLFGARGVVRYQADAWHAL